MNYLDKLKKLALGLEIASVAIAVLALLFRATVYGLLAPEAGAAYGTGDLVGLGIGILLFIVCSLCAVAGVVINLKGEAADKHLAFRAVLIGILSFVIYDFLYAWVPVLI